jgi:hypothetical protein
MVYLIHSPTEAQSKAKSLPVGEKNFPGRTANDVASEPRSLSLVLLK